MPNNKKEDMKPDEKKRADFSVKSLRLNASSAKLGVIYAEVLGRPVSKRRSIR